MNENEEFEFRYRLEQEQAAAGQAPAGPEQNLWQKSRPYVMPLVEGAAMTAGGILGGAAGIPASPSLVVNPVTGAMAGAGLGYAGARQLGEIADTYFGGEAPAPLGQQALGAAKDVATGAVLEGGGRAVLAPVMGAVASYVLPPVMRAAGWVWDQTGGRAVLVKGGRILREIAGDRLPEITASLANSAPGTTAGQAVAGAGVSAPTFQAMERRAAAELPEQFGDIAARQETARMAGLQSVTPDLAAAQAARQGAAGPLYRQADATTVRMDDELIGLLDRMPRGVMAHAARIAHIEGRPFVMGQHVPAQTVNSPILGANGQPAASTVTPAQFPQITGESLHYIKRALSDVLAKSPQAGASRDLQNTVREFLPEYLRKVESMVPAYGQARSTFSRLSPPVNQSEVLTEMQSILQHPALTGERVTPFLNALGRGEGAMLRRSTGSPRYEAGDLPHVLNANQMDEVTRVSNELRRDAAMRQQATAGTNRLNDILGEASQAPQIPNTLSVMGTAFNKILRVMSGRVSTRTLRTLSEAMQSGRSTLELMNTVPSYDRPALLRAIQQSQSSLEGTGATVNALAGDRSEYVTR